MDFNIKEELKKLPKSPGVYQMFDKNGEIIYVGKAVNLKNRVSQYFRGDKNKSPKTVKMVSHIAKFEYILTDSELEALVLECNLIKEINPKYNILLKDDKTYPYIKVTVEEDYPRIFSTRKVKRDNGKYFGPYSDATAVKNIIELLRKMYEIRPCNKKFRENTPGLKPCMYYNIHRCGAPCAHLISKEEYRKNTDNALEFLCREYKSGKKALIKKMEEASEDLKFEEAIMYRDLIKNLEHLEESQRVTTTPGVNRDIIAVGIKGSEAIAQIFFLRDGKIIGRDHFHIQVQEGEEEGVILEEFLKQFYSGTPFIPSEIMLSGEISESELLQQWLTKKKGSRVSILVPLKGKKEKLVELAKKNALLVLNQDVDRLKKEEERALKATEQLKNILGLEKLERIESYDISNISGFQNVGSMVVYEGGVPKKADYRKFKIKTVSGANDVGSMEEVLKRRLGKALENNSSFNKLPDLILMDGGKGQVNVAKKVIDELKLNIHVAGMIKNDKHFTRALLYNDKELNIDVNSPCFNLLERIQEEVHRFAITYHRELRSKEQTHSVLEDIKGVGEKRRIQLMKAFENIDAIKRASVEELKEIPAMNQGSAEAVYNFFHKGE